MFKRQRIDKRGIKGKGFPKPLKMEVKQHLILEEIAKGATYVDMVKKFVSEWGLSRTTVENEINDAIKFMKSQTTKDNLISMNMQRLDSIISDSITDKDRKNAIKAIDVQNKLAGGYVENVKIESDSEINFTFDIGE